MNDRLPHPKGTVQKSSRYLETLKNLTLDQNHPRHQGVAMQAHHAISAMGVSMTKHADRLVDFDYDINHELNLVFIPCTLQGACLLQVQPHRGNHTAIDPEDVDRNRSPSYHERVKVLVNNIIRDIERDCGKPGINIQQHTQK